MEADAAETEQECSPDGIYDNPQARELFEAYEPAETETSEEGDERRALMADAMMEEVPDGATVPSIRFMMKVDVIREDYKKKCRDDALSTNDKNGVYVGKVDIVKRALLGR